MRRHTRDVLKVLSLPAAGLVIVVTTLVVLYLTASESADDSSAPSALPGMLVGIGIVALLVVLGAVSYRIRSRRSDPR